MDVTGLVRQAAPIGYSALARGHIYGGEHHPKAAPTSFSERVWVILPEGSSEHLYGPCRWLAGHGTAKPQPGSECVVGFDEQNQPVIVWWDGAQTEPVPAEHSITEAMLEKALQERVTQDTGWKTVSFENSWKNLGGAFLTAAYRKQGNVVRLRGTIEGGASAKAAFTLPEGFRPTAETFSSVANGAGAAASLTITVAGVATPAASAISTIGLDAISFTID